MGSPKRKKRLTRTSPVESPLPQPYFLLSPNLLVRADMALERDPAPNSDRRAAP
jgi:hypothetical protein